MLTPGFIRRRVSVLACAIATATFGVESGLFEQSARAAIVDLSCPLGGVTATYSPGLTNTPQQTNITIDGAQTTCVSLGDPTIQSGRYQSNRQGERSCLPSPLNPYDLTYNWNNGKTSTVHFVSSENIKAEGETVVTSIGTVIDGEFKGDQAVRTATTTTLSPEQCLTPEGVTSDTGTATLTLTRV